MTSFLWWAFQASMIVCLLIPVYWLASQAMAKRPAVQHLLWMVLLMKLMTPAVVSWPWAIDDLNP